ncbi:MAG: DUF11 domain-containing protein [Xanthomonadales bacterium]|nr:DUF11 domain-containing protein [Xanthomonadales bacterium]
MVYTIIVSNTGPSAATGATLAVNPPAALTEVVWQCVPAGSTTTCPGGASGSGSGPMSATVNLPAGSHLRYDLSARVIGSVGANVISTATITPPGGLSDPNPANNSASHSVQIIGSGTIFQNGFEGGNTAIQPEAAKQALQQALRE